MPIRTVFLMLMTAGALVGPVIAEAAGGATTAVLPSEPADPGQSYAWTPRKLQHFVSPLVINSQTGIWEEASCDQIYASARILLLSLGARASDLDVDQRACYAYTREHSVDVKFSVVAPADVTAKNAAREQTDAHWQTVALTGNCQFLQYVTKTVLPLFSTRNVKLISSADCAKLGVGLYAQVLKQTQESAASP